MCAKMGRIPRSIKMKQLKEYIIKVDGRFLIQTDLEFANEYKEAYLNIMPNSNIEIQEI